MPTPETLHRVKHLYRKCLVDLNEWEKQFISDMMDRVTDGEGQNLPVDDFFITRRQAEKVDEIWEKVGL